MQKKLVKYDQWHFTEVDQVRLRRKAVLLQQQIRKKVTIDHDQYEFYSLTLPFVEAAIRGEIHETLDEDTVKFISGNFDWDRREGNLPPEYDHEFTTAVAGFSVCLQGLSLEPTDEVLKDGAVYRWVDFEEDGDWPQNVKYP